MTRKLNTETVVALLRAAGLVAAIDTRRTKRTGFHVRAFGTEVAVLGDTMTDADWSTAMAALEGAGLTFTYRSDEGRGARVAS